MRSILNYEKIYSRKKYKKEVRLRNIAIFETLISTGVRVTEFILPRTRVNGNGTRSNPWYFLPKCAQSFGWSRMPDLQRF